MKRKVFAAFLMAGALVVAPFGSMLSMTSSASSNNTVSNESSSVNPDSFIGEVVDTINATPENGTLVIDRDQGINALSNSMMKALLERGDVRLVLECSHEGNDYTIVIPAGKAVNNDIPWYGPLYLLSVYGNSASYNIADGSGYVVKENDTMSGIAQQYGMTLAQLAAMNPQVTDVNLIRIGQVIKVK